MGNRLWLNRSAARVSCVCIYLPKVDCMQCEVCGRAPEGDPASQGHGVNQASWVGGQTPSESQTARLLDDAVAHIRNHPWVNLQRERRVGQKTMSLAAVYVVWPHPRDLAKIHALPRSRRCQRPQVAE